MKKTIGPCALCIVLLFSFYYPASAQWVPAGGFWGVGFGDVAVCENTYFVTTSGGIFRSSDNGGTWIKCDFGQYPEPSALAVSNAVIYAGGICLLRSSDYGESWTEVNSVLSDSLEIIYRSLAINGSTIFMSVEKRGPGVGPDAFNTFRSTDNGETWSEVDSSLPKRPVMYFSATGSTVFAGGINGIYRSTNNGETWECVIDSFVVSALCANENVVVAGNNGSVAWRSIDNGTTWEETRVGSGVQALAFIGGKIFAGTFNKTYCSTDMGKSWTATDVLPSDVKFFDVNGSNAIAGTDQKGVYISTDGGKNWSTSGLAAVEITSLASIENTVIAGTDSGIFISTDTDNDWALTRSGAVLSLAVMGENKVFAGLGRLPSLPISLLLSDSANLGGVSLSTDNGATWVSVTNSNLSTYTSVVTQYSSYYDLTCLTVQDTTLFGVYGGQLSQSDDYGESWASAPRYCSTVLASGGDTLFAGDSSGKIFRSIDKGANWTVVDSGLTRRSVFSFASKGDYIFSGTSNGLFRSGDKGESWIPCDSGIADTAVTAFAVYGDAIFAGTNSEGIFISTDHGLHWSAVNEGLTVDWWYGVITCLAVHDGTLFAGTPHFGLWRRPLSEMVEPANAHQPGKLPEPVLFNIRSLNRNGSTTAVEFVIPRSDLVTVKMYTLVGKEVASLVNKRLEAGVYRYFLDTHTIAQGCYAVKIQAGATCGIRTIQMVY